jgi:hypothetical protein
LKDYPVSGKMEFLFNPPNVCKMRSRKEDKTHQDKVCDQVAEKMVIKIHKNPETGESLEVTSTSLKMTSHAVKSVRRILAIPKVTSLSIALNKSKA